MTIHLGYGRLEGRLRWTIMLKHILNIINQSEAENDRQFVVALSRGLSILYIFKDYPEGLSYQKICELTDLPKSTVTRLIYTMGKLGFIMQHPDNSSYVWGENFRDMLASPSCKEEYAERIRPFISHFAHEFKVSVSVAFAVGAEMYYAQSVRSPAKVAVQLNQGSTVPLAETAIGRAYYAEADENERQHIREALQRKFSDKVYREKMAMLDEAVKLYDKTKFCICERDFAEDIHAIAVTFHNSRTTPSLMALNVSVPIIVPMDKLIDEVLPALRALASKLSEL